MKFGDWKQYLQATGYVKPIGTTFVVTSLGWLLYEVNSTANTLKNIGQIGIKQHEVKYIHLDDKMTKGLAVGRSGCLEPKLGRRRVLSWLHGVRYRLAWRLLHLAQTDEPQTRDFAVHLMASTSRHLSEPELTQLAQACDANTAVGLARCRLSPQHLFTPAPSLYKALHHQEIISEIRDVLFKLNQERKHLCVKYFLSKAFPEYEKQKNYLLDAEVMLTEPWIILTSQDNLLPLCVQALDHHIATVNTEELLVELGGLPLLMVIYQHLQDNTFISKMICRILTRICSHPEFLPKLFESGWVGVLSQWMNCEDPYLSLMATQCLTNLDRDEPTRARYGRHVMPLHPSRRTIAPRVDVVFVHGLLGGVLSTWRQRNPTHKKLLVEAGLQRDGLTMTRSSDEHTREYLDTLSELSRAEWDQLGSDYEFVVSDFPVNTNSHAIHQYSLSGIDKKVRQYGDDQTYTLCWPKDWLPQDCPSIRVLGIDYESRLSEWFPTCSEKLRLKTLEERSTTVLEELRDCGIGNRPTVWVAHSMGGLLVKKMLTDALSSSDPQTRSIALNSRAVVFLSTPHLGCPLAKMNDILNYLLWPSTEVEELRHKAKSTRISSLGVDLHIVPPEFSYFDVGDLFEMPCDHTCVAKPYNRLSFIYQIVLNLIRKVQEEAKI